MWLFSFVFPIKCGILQVLHTMMYIMDKEIKIVIVLIGFLSITIIALLFFVSRTQDSAHVLPTEEQQHSGNATQFVDSSRWRTYTSTESGYAIKYPKEWEFNLVDGTAFYPMNCTKNKYDKCVAHVSVNVYPDTEQTINAEKKCRAPQKVTLRYVSGDVSVCRHTMSDEFAVTQGYNRKEVYYVRNSNDHVFEITVMYMDNNAIYTEEEMVQTFRFVGDYDE